MRFEEVVAIWETQVDKPAFALNDFGLQLALYQSRDQARRRLFWGTYFPFFVGSLFLLGALALAFLAFVFQDTVDPEEIALTAWDGLAFFVGATACVLAASSMYASRRQHEKSQSIFAPSLRQEIERSIVQVEFEIFAKTSPRVWRNVTLVDLGAMVLAWEGGRLNDIPLPWGYLLATVFMFVLAVLLTIPGTRRAREAMLPRKKALEALRTKLDESPPPRS